MRVLLTHRYFWPDTPPYASLLRTIASYLRRRGGDVEVYSALPSYRTFTGPAPMTSDMLDGVRVRRARVFREAGRGRFTQAVNALLYSIQLGARLIFSRYDVVTVASYPPIFTPLLVVLIARVRGMRAVYHCQDLHPEVDHLTRRLGLSGRLMRRIDTLTCQLASDVVVLSEDMKQTLLARPGMGRRDIQIINNFEPEAFSDLGETLVKAGDTGQAPAMGSVKVVYAGNLGRFQALDCVIRAFAAVPKSVSYTLYMVGDGLERGRLMTLARDLGESRIHFLSHRPFSEIKDLLQRTDIGLVSLHPGVMKAAYPSKVMPYLANGCAVMAFVDPDSGLSNMLRKYNAGWIVPLEPEEMAAGAITVALEDVASHELMRENALACYSTEFDRQKVLSSWWHVLMEPEVSG